jgi:hypothetical protein
VVYDGRRERAYWLAVQDYFADRPAAELFRAGEWINVRIPASRRFDRGAVRRIARRKNELHHRFERKARGDASPPH